FGSRVRGRPGAAVALRGLIGPPVELVTLLGMLYARYGEIEPLARILSGVSAAAVGLFIAVSIKMAAPVFRKILSPGPFIAFAAFLAVGILRWPLPWVLVFLAPLSIAIAWWRTR
ncbi:MAG: chromate transporter, partial [Rhizobiales bacterium]|nr:chromate transporter [Hyphomicrobiales bacterium]